MRDRNIRGSMTETERVRMTQRDLHGSNTSTDGVL